MLGVPGIKLRRADTTLFYFIFETMQNGFYELDCQEFETYWLMGNMLQAHEGRQRVLEVQSNFPIMVLLRVGGPVYME